MASGVVCQYLEERTGFHAVHICVCLSAVFGSIVGIRIQWHVSTSSLGISSRQGLAFKGLKRLTFHHAN
jgi:hypothetical protein